MLWLVLNENRCDMSSHIKFGKSSINPAAVAHATWRVDSNNIEVFTTSGFSVLLPAEHEDAEAAAKALGLQCCYDEWAEPIKAAAKTAAKVEADAAKVEAAEAKAEHKAAHAHK